MTNVLESLGQEHQVFRRLIVRLRGASTCEAEPGRVRIVQTLLVLLPALQKHDELEEGIFGRPQPDWAKDQLLAHRLIDAQHSSIRAMREEIEAILACEREATFARLSRLAEILAEKLNWHLETEEMLLWPLFAQRTSRTLDASMSRRAQQSLRELKYAVARLEEGVEEPAS